MCKDLIEELHKELNNLEEKLELAEIEEPKDLQRWLKKTKIGVREIKMITSRLEGR